MSLISDYCGKTLKDFIAANTASGSTILTDGFSSYPGKHPFVKLWRTRGVDMKIKAVDDGFMHLKAYSISNVILRTGSANDSVSGPERQDNDILVITDKVAIESFNRKFESMWSRTSNTGFEFHE